jgi:hypothetical protein
VDANESIISALDFKITDLNKAPDGENVATNILSSLSDLRPLLNDEEIHRAENFAASARENSRPIVGGTKTHPLSNNRDSTPLYTAFSDGKVGNISGDQAALIKVARWLGLLAALDPLGAPTFAAGLAHFVHQILFKSSQQARKLADHAPKTPSTEETDKRLKELESAIAQKTVDQTRATEFRLIC